MRFRTVLAILFFCVAGMAAGEHYDVRHYSIEDGLSQNTVMTILQDKQGYMWFGTWDGLNRFDGYSFKVFKAMDSNGKEARVNNRVEAIYEDANGCIWWKTYDNHYYMLDRSRSKVSNKGVDELPKEMIRKLAELDEVMRIDKHGIMWKVDDEPGILRGKDGDWKRLSAPIDYRFKGQQREHFMMTEDCFGRTWVNPNGGGWAYYDSTKDELVNPLPIISNTIHAAYVDRDGLMWIASFDGGVDCINMQPQPYSVYDLSNEKSLGEVRAFVELRDGSVKRFSKDEGLVYSALDSRYGLLLGYKGRGLVNSRTGEVIKTSHPDIYDIEESQDGTLFVATYGGGVNILHYDREKKQFDEPKVVGNKAKVRDIVQVGNTLWCGTTSGLLRINLKDYSSEITPFYDIRTLYYHDETLWFGTFGGGLYRIDLRGGEEQIQHIDTYCDIVLNITGEGDNIWYTTERDIRQYNTRTQQQEIFDPLQNHERCYFTEAEALRDKSGKIYFGTSRGYCVFDPQIIQTKSSTPPLYITGCRSDEKELSGDTVYIDHGSNISIEYAALDFLQAPHIVYSYRMDGIDNDWRPATHQRHTTYSNLRHGTYRFRVYSSYQEGAPANNEASIWVVVRCPWWLSWWAIVLYVIGGIGVIILLGYVVLSYTEMQQKVEIEQQVTDIKLRFFTNISHELRTPLTLITAPVDNILANEHITSGVRSQLEIVQSNGQRMLRMVNQLLDFRKIQNKKMRLKIQKSLLSDLVMDTCANFRKEAADKHIPFTVTIKAKDSTVWVDRSRIDTIVFNLLSNAFKFTPAGKAIDVVVDEKPEYLLIIVKDEGIGIPMEKRNLLFVRFSSNNELSQTTGGTGIGLNLVKELVDLHHGYIEVESEVGKGTTFTVMLRKGKEHFGNEVEMVIDDNTTPVAVEQEPKEPKPLELEHTAKSTRKILVVDDNEDMRRFLKEILGKEYTILTAEDGVQAIGIVSQEMPDLIITDLMMPNMDGLELTQKIKSSPESNYIPLILLSAKSAIESRLQAMEYGADDYVTKPFEPEYLRARVHNIIAQREQLERRFRDRLLRLEPEEDNEPILEDQFLAKLLKFMDTQMDNNALTVEQLVDEMGLGRTVFYNKLKVLTGLSPVEFIREIRIKRAAQLLMQGKYNITEVTYMVGMNDSRYFSKCFKNTYGVTPSEYKRKMDK